MLTLKPSLPTDMEETLANFARQVEQDVHFDIAQAVAERPSIFVLRVPFPLPQQNAAVFQRQWVTMWASLKVRRCPPILILDRGIELVGLNEGDLANLGFFKAMPPAPPAAPATVAVAVETPGRPTHPGIVLRDTVLPALGMDALDFVEAVGGRPSYCTDILDGKQQILFCDAQRIEKLTGINTTLLLTMQDRHDTWTAEAA